MTPAEHDAVRHPRHYTSHPSGVEVINYSRLLPFGPGSAVKYVMRRDLKGNPIQDLDKAIWFLNDSIDSGVRYSSTRDMQRAVRPVIEAEEHPEVRVFLRSLYYPSERHWVDYAPDLTEAVWALQKLRKDYAE